MSGFFGYKVHKQRNIMKRGTRIGPDGSIISDEDGSSSGGSGSGSGAGGGRRSLCPSSVDTFGFHLELKHFAIVLLFISVTMGPIGSEFYNVCLHVINVHPCSSIIFVHLII